MFFRDMVESAEEWREYEKLLAELAAFVGDCVCYLVDAFDVAMTSAAKDPCYSHATVLMLIRHIIESIDGVSVLVEKGCAENCGPLLRSAFEAQLGVLYILEEDSKRRALAYQVAHAHRKMKLYRKLDAEDQLGKQLRAEVEDEPYADIFDRIPADLKGMAADLERLFERPEFGPVEEEWQAVKAGTRGDPEWFALFGGPRTVRELALRLKLGAAYEVLYRGWSDVVHAGSGLNHVAPSGQSGIIHIRPIRHPEGIETACNLGANMCLHTARHIVHAYAPEQFDRFRQAYMETLRSRHMQLCRERLSNAPWR